MTFEDFQTSRQCCDDLHEHFPEDTLPDTKGWLYCNGQFWIEDTSSWPRDAPGFGHGRWYVRIGNQEYQSDNQEDCEMALFEFAKSVG